MDSSSSSKSSVSSHQGFVKPPDGSCGKLVIDRDMTDEEYVIYHRAVQESDGFDVPKFPGTYACGRIEPLPDVKCFGKWLQEGAAEAIKDYNLKNETNFEVVELEKATTQGSYGLRFFITFKVKPIGTPSDYSTITFQAKVLYAVEGLEIELCRIKPEFDLSWVPPKDARDLLLWDIFGSKFDWKRRTLWICGVSALLWTLWLERNSRIFNNCFHDFDFLG